MLGGLAFDAISIAGGAVHHVLGGSAVYAGLAGSLVGTVTVMTAAGDDCGPGQLAGLRGRYGLTLIVQHLPGGTTRFACDYDAALTTRTTLALEPGVANHIQVNALPLGSTDVLFLASGPPAIQLATLQAARPRWSAVDTIDRWIHTERAVLDEVIGQAGAVLMTAEEVLALADRDQIADAAALLLARGPRLVCVKLGESGAQVFGEGFQLTLPAFAVRTVDPTGAGDAFGGAFLAHLASHRGDLGDAGAVGEALVVATAASSICVEDFGTGALEGATAEELARRCRLLRPALRRTTSA